MLEKPKWINLMAKVAISLVLATILLSCGTGDTTNQNSTGSDIGNTGDNSDSGDTGSDSSRWQPDVADMWQWQLDGPVDTTYDVDVYDIDLFESSAELINGLRSSGRKVVCYFSAGSYENGRPDTGDFKAEDLGGTVDGWPEERWLDIRSDNVRAIMKVRLDLARQKGCDGVEPDWLDSYVNTTGFPLTADDQLDYNRFLAQEAHGRGLAIALKNDIDQVAELVDDFDFAVNEQCHEYHECDSLTPFINAGKPVFNAEYADIFVNDTARRQALCADARKRDFRTLVLPLDLDDSFRYSCDGDDDGESKSAPWLGVNGKWIVDSDGNHVVLRGIDLIDLGVQENDYGGIASIIDRITDGSKGWCPKVLRLAVYPSSYDGDGGDIGGPGWTGAGADNYYNRYLKPATDQCDAKNIYFIIDWHAIDNYDGSGYDSEIDAWTTDFWSFIAAKYKDNPRAIFELFNEPKSGSGGDIRWSTYKPYIQNWVDTIRTIEGDGDRHLILASSPNWTESAAEAVHDPLVGDPIAYTVHNYPDIDHGAWKTNFGDPSEIKPIVLTEWGYCASCDYPVTGTQSSYGDAFKAYVDGKANVGWTYWSANWDWEHDMFDSNWNLLGGNNYSGEFCKEWLHEKRNSDVPQAGPKQRRGTWSAFPPAAGERRDRCEGRQRCLK